METELQQRAFLLLLGLVSIAFFWVLLPFYGAVFWAIILAIVFRPLQRWLEAQLGGRRNLAAALSVLACVLIAILPVTVIVVSFVGQIETLVQRVQEGEIFAPDALADLFAGLPGWMQAGLGDFGPTDFEMLRERAAETLSNVGQALASQALNVGQDTLRFVASVGVMLYLLFFLFRDGPQIGNAIRLSLPFSLAVSDALIARFAEVVRATVKGNVIIATLQGTIGGMTFWLLGIPGALVWGAIMVFLSLLPVIGSALVWAPWAVYLILSGNWLSGGILVAVGVAVIGLVDNLLRPPLVGSASRLPDYVVLVSTLGGLVLFGINGFVIGPLIAALFVACWTLFRDARAGRTKPSVG
jgi:predicted PurR-regulated permease PerM